MSELRLQFADHVPVAVVRTIYEEVVPQFKAWVRSAQVDVIADFESMDCQRHENLRDWVWKIHLRDGTTRVFHVEMRTLN